MSQEAPQQSTVNYNSRTANNRASVLIRNKPLVIHGLVANVVYFAGAASFVVFATLELNGRERDTPALVTYTTAFVCFLLNAVGELYIDLFSERNIRHGRYSRKVRANVAISCLFVLGTILDTVAFFLWIERQFVPEHRVLFVSSHAWLLTAILALWGQVPGVDTTDVMEGLDDAGNLLFFVGTIIDVVVRYVDTNFDTGSPEPPVAKLEFSSSPIWMVSALCYILADILRVRKMRRNGNSNNISRQPPAVSMAGP